MQSKKINKAADVQKIIASWDREEGYLQMGIQLFSYSAMFILLVFVYWQLFN